MKGYEEFLLGAAAGLAQGLFEWLPVSSKTILLLIFYQVGLNPSAAYLLSLFLNGSTAAAAIAYLRRDVLKIIRAFVGDEDGLRLLKFLLISTAATGIMAPSITLIVTESLERLDRLSMLLIGALYLLMSLLLWRGGRIDEAIKPDIFSPYKDGMLAGLAQGLSALPGVSRSGITILALLALGRRPSTALKLSFLMSIPATLGGSAYAILLNRGITASLPAAAIITAIITAITISLITISTLLRISRKLKPHLLTMILAAITILIALIPTQNL